MICVDCRKGADLATAVAAPLDRLEINAWRTLHGRCKGGGWCDCQHREPPVRSPRKEIQTLSLLDGPR